MLFAHLEGGDGLRGAPLQAASCCLHLRAPLSVSLGPFLLLLGSGAFILPLEVTLGGAPESLQESLGAAFSSLLLLSSCSVVSSCL